MGNGNYHFVTGGGRFNSLPFGQYHVNPGQIGPDGRRIGAIAGVSDASTGNTVHDPTYTGSDGTHSRGGIEIHPLDSRNITNGCVGIPRSEWSQFSQAFNQMRAQGQPIVLNHTPQGITIGPAQAPQTAQTAQTAQGPESEDAMYARTVNEIETSSKGGRGGLGNFGSEGPKYGLTPQNQNDPKAVQEAYRQERADKGPKFEQRVGRKPSLNEHYVMHQQGLEGGIALYQQPNELAAKVLAPFYGSEAQAAKIIQANGGNPQGTAKNFTDMWEARFNRNQRGTQPPAPPPSQAPQRLPPQIDTPGRQGSVQPNQQIAFAGGGPSSNPDVNRMMEQRLDARRPPGDDVPGLLAPSDLDRAMRPSDDRYNLGTERVLPTPPGHDRNVIPIDPGDQWQQQAFNSDPRRSPWDRQANHPGFTAPNAPLGDRDAGGFQDPGAYRPQIGPAPRSMQQQPWPDQPPPEDDDPITNYNENPQQIPPRNDYPIPQKGSRQEQAQLEQYLARLFGLDWV
jgi:hypothetical protein